MYENVYKRIYSFFAVQQQHEDIQKLVDSGFYYSTKESAPKCHHCGFCLIDWKECREPDLDHIRGSTQCLYIQNRLLQNQNNVCITNIVVLEEINSLKKHLKQLTELYTTIDSKLYRSNFSNNIGGFNYAEPKTKTDSFPLSGKGFSFGFGMGMNSNTKSIVNESEATINNCELSYDVTK